MRRVSVLAAVVAILTAAPVAVSAQVDPPSSLRVQPLPAELAPDAAIATESIELRARAGRPVWLLPVAGMVTGAIVYPMLIDDDCYDCMLYIPEQVTGGIIGLLGGITLEVVLMIADGDDAALAPPTLSLSTRPSAARTARPQY